ncbi:TRM11 family SAM-dependent methyltransferase [Planococcus shixiaomingii]|uniref:TRM11 family SAM-dependent methyltransferase n=1 Tax=Planococcus shixiaomingii TaxID=3058393 RepID=UPI002630DD83|nr:RNA methyltransferase [Planococcus sp. N022]WKA53067.1 RNA methyltransferase [Planococcus sp. N022]
MNKFSESNGFIYTYAYTSDEKALCKLEMRALFGKDTDEKLVKSPRDVDPSRSPFIKERIEILFEGDQIADILSQMPAVQLSGKTFKVIFVKINSLPEADQVEYWQKREIESQLGRLITGKADVRQPDRTFGIVSFQGRWYFGNYKQSESVWFRHQKKPNGYSTALSTKVARAVANIAAPNIAGIKMIDPCCGIGTVLVEGLSMGMDIVGRDINPLVVNGSRENIAHFQLKGNVDLGPISEVKELYDVAVIDMPYNLYTSATPEEQFSILKHANSFTEKLIVVTLDNLDSMVERAGFIITDRCIAKKAGFSREILVCKKERA